MMIPADLKEAIQEAIKNHIPFQAPDRLDFHALEHAVSDVATEMGYVKAFPHEFKDRAWAFHMGPDTGMRWGYVRNDEKVGWFEGRETTPLPERDVVMKDASQVYGHETDLIKV